MFFLHIQILIFYTQYLKKGNYKKNGQINYFPLSCSLVHFNFIIVEIFFKNNILGNSFCQLSVYNEYAIFYWLSINSGKKIYVTFNL